MDLHNRISNKHFAWFDKHIATDNRGKTNESQVKAITPEKDYEGYVITSHKSENLINYDMDLNDVLFDKDIITHEEWLNTTSQKR